MIRSKLSSKAQTTVPRAVRDALALKAGDEIGYRVENGQVIMLRAEPEHDDADEGWDPFATFWEWNSPEMRKAYDDA